MGIFDVFRAKKELKSPKLRTRGYYGVNSGRLFADFNASEASADTELRSAIVKLRARSRDLSINNHYARRYFELLKTNVVGEKGVSVQVKALDGVGNLDVSGNQAVESAFHKWSKYGNCTVDGKMSWIDVQKLVMELVAKDGEAFIIMHRNNSFTDSFALEIIEADKIDEQKNERLKNGNEIRMGVEIDKFKRPIAYHMLTYHPGDWDYTTQIKSPKHIRITADRVIHVYKKLRPGQSRGEPWMTPAISAIKQLGAYTEAAIVNARVGASKMGFFTSPGGDGFVADDYDGELPIMSATPGEFANLPAGVQFESFDPAYPNNEFENFHKAVLRGIASALGVSYTALSNDLEGASYSSIRQGALEERDSYKNMTRFLIENFIEPVYRSWLEAAMEVETFGIPLRQYDKFADAVDFKGRGFNWVDPQKEMNAAIMGIKNGVLSLSSVASQYGMDTEELLTQIARDKKLAEQFGVEYVFEPYGSQRGLIEDDVVQAE